MRKDADRFSRLVVEIASKRAAQRCSNPECGALTSGPSASSDKSVTVGEAAHIFGARPGAARFDPGMSIEDRGVHSNAIWLCRNCHKLVDADEQGFPSALLFKWREIHEAEVSKSLGRANERLRRDAIDEQMRDFAKIGPFAKQILNDRPPAWEFRFTADLLRTYIRPVLSRWNALREGLYARPIQRISQEDTINWLSDRLIDLPLCTTAIVSICNHEFVKAWGPPGTAGSPEAIAQLCELFAENCKCLLDWEEVVRFTRLPDVFEEMSALLVGLGGRILEQVSILPQEMSRIFGQDDVSGDYRIDFVINVRPGWEDEIAAALERAKKRLFM